MGRKHSDREKQELVNRYQKGESVRMICTETGVPQSTFYNWIHPYQTATTDKGYTVTPLNLTD